MVKLFWKQNRTKSLKNRDSYNRTFWIKFKQIYLSKQMNMEYEKALHDKNAVDCKMLSNVLLISSKLGILPFVMRAIFKKIISINNWL